jgi:DUF971 family protein
MSDDGFSTSRWPTEIRVGDKGRLLTVEFDDGGTVELPAELLRVFSPSAEVQGHSPSQRVLVHGRKHVAIMNVEPVGNYAIRIVFDDLHDSGIYSWQYLHELGETRHEKWQGYLAELAAKGLSRDP